MLKFSNIPRSSYYYYVKRKEIDKYVIEKQEILEIFNNNKGIYGYRRILSVLKNKGYTINHKTVLKLMKTLNIQGKQKKNKYKSYKGEVGIIAPNILKREFIATKPYEKGMSSKVCKLF